MGNLGGIVNCERLPEALAISNSEAKRWFKTPASALGDYGTRGGRVARQPELRIPVSRLGTNNKLLKTRNLKEMQSLSRVFSIT